MKKDQAVLLIVEDEDTVRGAERQLVTFLSGRDGIPNLIIWEATSIAMAMMLLRLLGGLKEEFSVGCLIDQGLPGGLGDEVAEMCERKDYGVPYCRCSGAQLDTVRFVGLGLYSKPFRQPVMAEILGKLFSPKA